MARKTFTPEQIINKLREAEVHISQGGLDVQATWACYPSIFCPSIPTRKPRGAPNAGAQWYLILDSGAMSSNIR
jgi:hypothetical protein